MARIWSSVYQDNIRWLMNLLSILITCLLAILGTFSKPRRQRQRERGKTKALMSRTMALHVHNKTWYIS